MQKSIRILAAIFAPVACLILLRLGENMTVGTHVPDSEAAHYVGKDLPRTCCHSPLKADFRVLPIPTALSAPGEVKNAWRTPSRGGINALYAFLRLNGVVVTYAEIEAQFREQFPRPSLLDLCHVSERWGVPATIRR